MNCHEYSEGLRIWSLVTSFKQVVFWVPDPRDTEYRVATEQALDQHQSHHYGCLDVRRRQERGSRLRREINLVRGGHITLGQWAGLDRSPSYQSLLQDPRRRGRRRTTPVRGYVVSSLGIEEDGSIRDW
jgi:hypothetical protein